MSDVTLEKTTTSPDSLYDDDKCVWLIVGWCVIWFVIHHLAFPLWKWRNVLRLVFSPEPVDRYRKRLGRSQVYCALAVAGGIYLFLGCRWHPDDLLYRYTLDHQVLFSMAAAHWAVSVWEDRQNWTFLSAGLATNDMSNETDPSAFLWLAYLLHHAVAGLAFFAVLRLRACTGLGTFGLLFELPVLYMNHREFLVLASQPPSWWRDPRQVEQFWDTLWNRFQLARYVPSLVYAYSLAFWWPSLVTLSWKQALTYHGMSIFFTVLNGSLAMTFLNEWFRKDMRLARGEVGSSEQNSEVASASSSPFWVKLEKEEAKEEANGNHETTKPLTKVTPKMWEAKGADNEDGHVWLEVDAVVYNVTEFLGEHPGGAAVLRRYAGKDASQAFHKARHSMKAKMMMQQYCVGPLSKPPRQYRIFEHAEQFQSVLMDFFMAIGSLAMVMGLLPCSWFPTVAVGEAHPLVELLAPGLTFSAFTGSLMMPMLAVAGPSSCSGGSLRVGAIAVAYFAALELVRRPMTQGPLSSVPSGLELAVAFILLIEDVLQLCFSPEGARSGLWKMTLAAVCVMLSWSMRGAKDVPVTDGAHLLGAILLAVSVPLLCRFGSNTRSKKEVVKQAQIGWAYAGLFSWLMLLALLAPSYDIAGLKYAVQHLWSSLTFSTFVVGGFSCAGALWSSAVMLNNSFVHSCSWTSRLVAIALSVAVGLRGGMSSWRWLVWIAWFAAISALGARNQAWMDQMQKKQIFEQVPAYRIATRAAHDTWFLVVGAFLWQGIVGPFKTLINMMMPEELQFYGPPIPLFDLGDDVDLGVAAYFAPASGVQSKVGPQHFVCNVSHMDPSHAGGERDLQLHGNSARDMWRGCSDSSTEGLIANINCFFPSLSGSALSKDINLSCWRSTEDAESWSRMHRLARAQASISGPGSMRTHGCSTAVLKPHGQIRHQDRCSKCKRLVESDTIGEKAPLDCRFCGEKNYGYPFF